MKKVILYLFLLIVLLLTSAGVWAYFEFLYTKPLNKAELAELTPDWEVVTHGNWSPWFIEADGTKTWNPAASFNAWVATIPEEDKAWPMLVDASYKYRDDIFDHEYMGSLPNDPERWAILKETLASDRSSELVEILKEALARPHIGEILISTTGQYEHDAMLAYGFEDEDWDPSFPAASDMISVLLPWLGTHRDTVRVLSSVAAYEIEQGHADEFIELMSLSMDSSHLSDEFPTLIGSLVRIAINAKCMNTIDWALVHHAQSFDDAQLLRLEQLLKRHKEVSVAWLGEALFMHDLIRRFTNSRGKMDLRSMQAWNTAGGAATMTSVPCSLPEEYLHASVQRPMYISTTMLQKAEAQSKIPWEQSKISADEFAANETDSMSVLFKLIFEVLTPSLDNASARARSYAQQSIGLRTAIAAHRYRLHHGVFPQTIKDMDGSILTFTPIDAFTGDQIKYLLTDAGPLIYSVADDRDDDQGASMSYGDSMSLVYYPKWIRRPGPMDPPMFASGDWMLYPTHREEPYPIEDDELDELVEDD